MQSSLSGIHFIWMKWHFFGINFRWRPGALLGHFALLPHFRVVWWVAYVTGKRWQGGHPTQIWTAKFSRSNCQNSGISIFISQDWRSLNFLLNQPTVLYVAPQLVGFLAVFPGLNMEIFRRTRVLFCGGASMSKGPALVLLERFKGYPLELREGKFFWNFFELQNHRFEVDWFQ